MIFTAIKKITLVGRFTRKSIKIICSLTFIFLRFLSVVILAVITAFILYTTIDSKKIASLPTKLYDRNKILLFASSTNKNLDEVSFNEIPDFLLNTLLISQKEPILVKNVSKMLFKEHFSIKFLKEAEIELNNVKTVVLFRKKQILEYFLNNVFFGGVFGINNASNKYFQKKVTKLSKYESVVLVSLIQDIDSKRPDLNKIRKNVYFITQKLIENKLLTKNEGINFIRRFEKEEPYIDAYKRAPLAVNVTLDYLQKTKNLLDNKNYFTSIDLKLTQSLQQEILKFISKNNYFENENFCVIVIEKKSNRPVSIIGNSDLSFSNYTFYKNISDLLLSLEINPVISYKLNNFSLKIKSKAIKELINEDIYITEFDNLIFYAIKDRESLLSSNQLKEMILSLSLNKADSFLVQEGGDKYE